MLRKNAFLVLFFFANFVFAQVLKFKGYTIFYDKPLPGATIKAIDKNSRVVSETTSNDKGFFMLQLPFNQDFVIRFEKESYCNMFAVIKGDVPEDKTDYNSTFEIRVPFFREVQTELNLSVFEKPITKLFFDGRSKFIDDPLYVDSFYKELNTPKKTVKPIKPIQRNADDNPPIIEKKFQLVGKVIHPEGDHIPYREVKVCIYDTAQHEICSTVTNKFGIFCFPSVNVNQASRIVVENKQLNDIEKAVITTSQEDIITTEKQFKDKKVEFVSDAKTQLCQKLINETYSIFLAGKLAVEENGEQKMLEKKFIYLMNEKNEVIEKVKTNMFGEFLFTKLPLDKNYIIAIDESDAELNQNKKLKLYTVKDIVVSAKDSLINGKFRYKFLVNDSKSFYEMIVEDDDLRMNLTGKIAGDQVTNVIDNLQLYLLNKDKKIIDSVQTGTGGNFNFKYIPYGQDYSISIKDTALLSYYKNVIIFDRKNNVVKYVSVKNKTVFEYKFLQNELSMLQEIFLHDPWMNLSFQASKNKSKSPLTITESIYFESGKSDIISDSKHTLDKIVYALQNSPGINVEISAHSDSKGSDDFNLKLSEKRAQSALAYIASKGVDKTRITAVGYGEKKPLNRCVNGVECTDEEHAKNRRLEFNVFKP